MFIAAIRMPLAMPRPPVTTAMTLALIAACLEPASARRFFGGAVNRAADQLAGFARVDPALDLDPFAGFKVFVMLEEMHDLVAHRCRQVQLRADRGIEWANGLQRHRDDLLVRAIL